MLDGMIQRWDELDDWVRSIATENLRDAGFPESYALTFLGERADVVVGMPWFVLEDADDIIETLVDLLGCLPLDRVAVVWPNRFEDEDTGDVIYAMRVNCAEPATGGAWRTYLMQWERSEDGVVEWGSPVDLDDDALEPWSQRLRAVTDPRYREQLRQRGWMAVPDEPWHVAAHPESPTLTDIQPIPGVIGHRGVLWPLEIAN